MSVQDPDPEEAMRTHELAQAEGRICFCTHLESFHWDYKRNSECAVDGCACLEYKYDVLEGIKMRAEQSREKTLGGVQATLEWAAQTSNARRAVSGATWDEAVAQMEEAAAKGERPLAFPDQPGATRKHDRAVLEAVRELGGAPGDLPA
jgi:hypothetical protein